MDASGNVYVSQLRQGRVLKFAPGAGEYEVFGTIPDWALTGGYGILGLAVDATGNVYGAVDADGFNGDWKFDCATGMPTRIAGTEDMHIANSLAFDDDGNLWVTDTNSGTDAEALGAIWRIGSDGSVEKWLENAELGGTGAFGAEPNGANGIAYHDGVLTVAVSEKVMVVEIPILADGSPDEITPIAEGIIVDGLAQDSEGNVVVAAIAESAIKRINTDGSIETLAAGAEAGLDTPSSVAFGVGGTELTVYAVNLVTIPAISSGVGPALVAVGTDIPGPPR